MGTEKNEEDKERNGQAGKINRPAMLRNEPATKKMDGQYRWMKKKQAF